MKEKLLQIRIDKELYKKIQYLQKIYGYATVSETVRNILEKEYRKEK